MSAATVIRPLFHPRPTLKARVAEIAKAADYPAALGCGECPHPKADHDNKGCNHIDTGAGPETLCSCTTPGGAR